MFKVYGHMFGGFLRGFRKQLLFFGGSGTTNLLCCFRFEGITIFLWVLGGF